MNQEIQVCKWCYLVYFKANKKDHQICSAKKARYLHRQKRSLERGKIEHTKKRSRKAI
jgi:hypothetical protein